MAAQAGQLARGARQLSDVAVDHGGVIEVDRAGIHPSILVIEKGR